MMVTNSNRPVYLNLLKIKLPIAGFMSILHRLSGVLMFLSIPPLIYLLALSLENAQGFDQAAAILGHPLVMLIQIVLIWSLMHHLLAGIRFLLIDIHIGVDKPHYRTTAWIVTLASPVLALIIVLGLML